MKDQLLLFGVLLGALIYVAFSHPAGDQPGDQPEGHPPPPGGNDSHPVHPDGVGPHPHLVNDTGNCSHPVGPMHPAGPHPPPGNDTGNCSQPMHPHPPPANNTDGTHPAHHPGSEDFADYVESLIIGFGVTTVILLVVVLVVLIWGLGGCKRAMAGTKEGSEMEATKNDSPYSM